MKQILLLFISIFSFIFAQAQESWSFGKCVTYALENNIQLKQQQLQEKQAEYGLLQSKLSILPTLSADMSYSKNFGKSIDPTTNLFVTRSQTANSYSATSGITLFQGLSKINNVKKNQTDHLASKLDTEKAKNDLVLNIASFYLQVLLAQEQVKISEAALEGTRSQLDQINKLVSAGARPETDRLEMEAQLAADESNMVVSQNQYDLAILSLQLTLDLNPTSNFVIVEPIIPLPDSNLIKDIDKELLYKLASENLPQIKAASNRLRSAEYGLSIARAGRSPILSAFGVIGTNYSNVPQIIGEIPLSVEVGYLESDGTPVLRDLSAPVFGDKAFNDQINENLRQSVGIGLSIPLFSQGRVNNNIQLAKLNVLSTQLVMQQTKQSLRNELEIALTSARASLRQFLSSQRSETAQSKAFHFIEEKNKLGMVNTLDYVNSKNQLTLAKARLVQSKYEYFFRMKILEFYQGKTIDIQ